MPIAELWNASVVLQGDVIWIASTMSRTIYEKLEVSCWGKYVIQFTSEATVGNVIMFEINRMRLGQPFSRFFSHDEISCQAACVESHCPPGAQRGRRGPARVTPAPAQPDSLIGSVFPSPPKHRPVSRSTGCAFMLQGQSSLIVRPRAAHWRHL
ncbi:hypothetical protein PG994_004285 [Apiospora phragmitis]|uniref:Uncharacterized protein n=1 Tax=Apiospora phragmitis TaxID=2905665 RepID=A0ABR1VSU8_9PEZI